MRRGDLYRVPKPAKDDPKRFRVFVVVSREALIDTALGTAIVAHQFVGALSKRTVDELNEGIAGGAAAPDFA